MGSTAIAWAVAALCGAVAIALFARLRQLVIEVAEARIGATKLEGELRTSREQLEREAGKLRRKSDELADLRKRHEKLRKRSEGAEAKGGAHPAGAVTDRELEEARQARDRARAEASSLAADLAKLRAAHDEALAAALATPTEGSISPAEADALRSEAAAARAESKGAKAEAESAVQQIVRLKKRLQAQETAYVSLRGELEAKKDRLATQNEELERLRALKVALVDSDAPADAGADETSPEPA